MQKIIGLIGILSGALLLSLELYMLKFIQLLEKTTGSWYDDVWRYAIQYPSNIALLIPVCIIIFSLIVFLTAKK